MEYAALVYQSGIANVFQVDSANLADYGREAKRLKQGNFRGCEAFAQGLVAAGIKVYSAHCNKAGDIQGQVWDDYLPDAPFFGDMHPVYSDTFAHIQRGF